MDLSGPPRPWLELGVATVGIIAGLGLFTMLSVWLLGRPAGGRLRYAFAAAPRTGRQMQTPDLAISAAPASDDTIATVGGADQAWSGSIMRAPIVFDTAPRPGVDRCRVVSRLVPLRAEPDEISRAHPLRLDVGDEVDVLRQDGPYCFVRAASGSEGWVPGLTLAGATGNAQPGAPDDGP